MWLSQVINSEAAGTTVTVHLQARRLASNEGGRGFFREKGGRRILQETARKK